MLPNLPIALCIAEAVAHAEPDHPVEDVQTERWQEKREGNFVQEVRHAVIQPNGGASSHASRAAIRAQPEVSLSAADDRDPQVACC